MESRTTTCPECGQENNPAVEMCTKCGASLDPREEDIDLEEGKAPENDE